MAAGEGTETSAERYERFFGDPGDAEEAPEAADEVSYGEPDTLAADCAREKASAIVAKIIADEFAESPTSTTLLAVTAATTFCAGAGLFDAALDEPPPAEASPQKLANRELRLVPIDGARSVMIRHGPGLADAFMTRPPTSDHRYAVLLKGRDVVAIEQRPPGLSRAELRGNEEAARRAAVSVLNLVDALLAGIIHVKHESESLLLETWIDDDNCHSEGETPFAHLTGVHPLDLDDLDEKEEDLDEEDLDGVIEVRYLRK
mmetsp:Transcript_7413/g.24464  ORF Transcript_7413/g.24464 Transcript_7413/m.24464 type:complete len:260 (-) Transcript_7413:204-983(-)